MNLLNTVIRQKFSEEFISKTKRARLTDNEFVDKLKKSKYIVFKTESGDDVKLFVNAYGCRFNIVKVKRGIVKTSVDGFVGYKKIEVSFLKSWYDEYKLEIE